MVPLPFCHWLTPRTTSAWSSANSFVPSCTKSLVTRLSHLIYTVSHKYANSGDLYLHGALITFIEFCHAALKQFLKSCLSFIMMWAFMISRLSDDSTTSSSSVRAVCCLPLLSTVGYHKYFLNFNNNLLLQLLFGNFVINCSTLHPFCLQTEWEIDVMR